MRRVLLLTFGGALLGSSIYVFPSGNPQPADLLFAIASVLVVFRSALLGEPVKVANIPVAWPVLTAWVVLVCFGWALYYGSETFLLPAAFWVFNLLVGISVVYVLSRGPRLESWLANALSLGLVVSGVGAVLDLGMGSRITGFFNNPNQLAYYSICAMGALLVLYRFRVPLRPLPLLALASGVVGVLGASSLAAMGGMMFLALGYAVANLVSLRGSVRFAALAVLALGVVVVVDVSSGGGVSENLDARMDRVDDKAGDWFEERNYDRVMAFPEYWALGAGEAHRERFYPYDGLEVHSSFGNMLLSYGIPGLVLFLILLWTVVRRAPFGVWMVLTAPLVYSLTHMGLRTTMFWVLLAVIWWVYGRFQRVRRQDLPERIPSS